MHGRGTADGLDIDTTGSRTLGQDVQAPRRLREPRASAGKSRMAGPHRPRTRGRLEVDGLQAADGHVEASGLALAFPAFA